MLSPTQRRNIEARIGEQQKIAGRGDGIEAGVEACKRVIDVDEADSAVAFAAVQGGLRLLARTDAGPIGCIGKLGGRVRPVTCDVSANSVLSHEHGGYPFTFTGSGGAVFSPPLPLGFAALLAPPPPCVDGLWMIVGLM
mgnify:CR=1 FL=1